ncbi:hypothetical protein RYX36_033207 [Vicia faba]
MKKSKRAKVNELKFYRLKAKQKMYSPNPQVRIRYKLEKAKRKETWLIEKLRKFDVPKLPAETFDPEILTEEERHFLKRTGEKKKHYVPVGRRGVFGGVVLNMHLHWKNHETVKVICKPCKPGQAQEYAQELARLSKGIVIDIKPNNIIIFYRGKNYVQPKVMSPPDTLSKSKTLNDVVRFSLYNPADIRSGIKSQNQNMKKSKRAKVNELKFYRLKAKQKMYSPNPQVRIRYKLEKAKRKETWLIEKLRKFDVPKLPAETFDPEILTEEERHFLKRTGEKKKHYVPVGRRGVFGGVVLNMHLHWKNHETVKVICKPCKPGQAQEYAQELARLSKGIVIDIKPNNIIIFYRGKNYVQPKVMSPPDTLSKSKNLFKNYTIAFKMCEPNNVTISIIIARMTLHSRDKAIYIQCI